MKTLKVNQLEKDRLSQQEKEHIRGGAIGCGCSCMYEGRGGSNTSDNRGANAAGGLHTPNMYWEESWVYEQGKAVLTGRWVTTVPN